MSMKARSIRLLAGSASTFFFLCAVSLDLARAQSATNCNNYAENVAARTAGPVSGAVGGAISGAIPGMLLGGIFGGRRGWGRGAGIGAVLGGIGGVARTSGARARAYDAAFHDCMRNSAK